MRLPLPKSRSGRLSVLISLLLGVSAFVPLPLPMTLVNKAIAMRAPELSLEASGGELVWGLGEVRLLDLRLLQQEETRVRVDRLDVALDLWPGSAAFGKPIRLHIKEADGQLDQSVVTSLSKLASDDFEPFPMAIQVRDSALRWTDAQLQDYWVNEVTVFGHMSQEGARFEVEGQCLLPAVGSFEVKLSAGPGLHEWQVGLQANAAMVRDWPSFSMEGTDWSEASFDLHAFASGRDLELLDIVVDGRAAVDECSAVNPRLLVTDTKVRFNGNLANGIRFQIDGEEAHSPFEMELLAAVDEQYNPRLHLSAKGKDTVVDAETMLWLTEMLPDVGEIVTALEPRGQPLTAFECSWSKADGFAWNLHVDPAGTSITYRGLLDDDGTRFSFPYPATQSTGSVVACSDAVLFFGDASVGGSGVVGATGIIDFRGSELLAIDIHAEEVPIDTRIRQAIAGNPIIAKLWRELGAPEQGEASFDVEIRYEKDEFNVRVAGNASDLSVLPAMVPVRADIDFAWFEWVPGVVRFGASMNALGGGVWLDGNLRDVANREAPEARLTLRGRGFNATQAELRTLERYLHLPKGLSDFRLSGEVFYDIMIVQPLETESPGHISGQLLCEGATMSWPALDIAFEQLHAQTGFASHGEDVQIGVARSWSQVDGGTLNASLNLSSVSQRSEAVAAGHDFRLTNDLNARLQDLGGQQPWGRHLDWGGTVDVVATVDPFQPKLVESHVDFHPLTIGIPGEDEDIEFELRGRIGVRGERTASGSNFPQFNAHALTFSGQDVDLAVQDLNAYFDKEGLQVEAKCSSSTGISLSSRLPLLADEETMLALTQIGLSGIVRPTNLRIKATSPYSGNLRFNASGGLVMDDVAMTGGVSALTGGHAEISVREAEWNGPQDFRAVLDFQNGSARVAGLALNNATARVHLNPERVVWTDVVAETLGGKLHTRGRDSDGTMVDGYFRLKLDKDAPVSTNVFVTGLQLERMRDELGLGGPLAGVVDGHIDVDLPSPSPTFAKGSGWFHINGGALGTVPVLKSIFRFAGVSPPVFDEGDVRFRVNGSGRVNIDEFSLQHPLLRVTGKGSMDMDTTLQLKVTLRTFGFVGRLPLLKDLIDFLVEQQVYGPAEAPIITHRASGKLFEGEFERAPFPLWVPAGPQPNWKVSPIYPVQ
ncbi:MAG: AsmA-like C-terminal region-containing protein [Planctomycetes bacterium]|nr:AsmA-like C-terminal region-containing protein [Planctomycetota bacterium]